MFGKATWHMLSSSIVLFIGTLEDLVTVLSILLIFDTTTPKEKTTASCCEWIALFF